MTVSTRDKFVGSAVFAAMILAGGAAFAGGDKNGHGSFSTPPQTQQSSRGYSGSPVVVPGVSVRAPNVIVNQGSVFNQNTVINRSAVSGQPGIIFGNGGFAVSGAAPVAPSTLNGLNVLGADQTVVETVTEQVPVTEETCAPRIETRESVRPVQAVCIDDKGTPHPASRLTADEAVDVSYNGEVFRCLAGTHMQVTYGDIVNGQSSFAQGETFSCRKGESLNHRNGELVCATAAPQRNCNERSLLRRHGPGIKLIRQTVTQDTCVPQQRTVLKTVTREVERVEPNVNGQIVFDGGVGQTVY